MHSDDSFKTFLAEIRPTDAQRGDLVQGHETIRNRLMQDPRLANTVITTFLQGSYRRHTAVRPRDGERPDVDVVVVTNLDERTQTAAMALGHFRPFLNTHYNGKWRTQGRSFGIEMSRVDIDLVITAAPPQQHWGWLRQVFNNPRDDDAAIDWKRGPLRIPDRRGNVWENTDPLEQIAWTQRKNAATNGHFVNVVKAIKWWRLQHAAKLPKHPKGFPLERIVGQYCPGGIRTVAEGVTHVFEAIAHQQAKPGLQDYGCQTDVLRQVTYADWQSFWMNAREAARIARQALDSNDAAASRRLWRELFGSKFPI